MRNKKYFQEKRPDGKSREDKIYLRKNCSERAINTYDQHLGNAELLRMKIKMEMEDICEQKNIYDHFRIKYMIKS